MYFIELIGFIQYYGVLKRPFLKECVPKKCREIYAQIPPQVGFVPPHLYPPYGGGHIPPPWQNLYGQPCLGMYVFIPSPVRLGTLLM